MGRGAVARGGGACARPAWTAQYVRDVSIDRRAIAQFDRAGATTRPRWLSSRKILVGRDLHHAALLRSDARARAVHSPRCVPDRDLSRRVQLRALAGRRIFLEQDRPGIHADVDRGRVVFPGAARRRDLARSSSGRARILTANALECSGRFRYHHLQGKAAPGAAGRLKTGSFAVNILTKTATDPATAMSPAEWQARVDLAAVYRLVAHHGWDDGIYNHVQTLSTPAHRRAFSRRLPS